MGKAFESIKQGLSEAIGHAKGEQTGVTLWRPRPVDVAAVRGRVGFTQAQFAARFGVSVATLRHWERGDRTPHGPALVLLNLIERDPGGVLRSLDALLSGMQPGDLSTAPGWDAAPAVGREAL